MVNPNSLTKLKHNVVYRTQLLQIWDIHSKFGGISKSTAWKITC